MYLAGSVLGYVALAIVALWDDTTLRAVRGIAPSPAALRTDDPIGFPSALGLSSEARVYAQAVVFVLLFALYAVAIRRFERLRPTARDLWIGVVLVGAAASLMLPLNSGDLLAYLGFGRVAGVYGVSPYVGGYATIDDFYTPFAWHTWRMPYGPAVLPPLTIAGLLSQLDTLLALYFLKLVSLALHAAGGLLLLRLRRDDTGMPPEKAAFIFLFNPLVVVELVGNGHNDGLLIAFVLGSFALTRAGRDTAALVAALAAALVKPPAVLVFVALLAALFWRRRWRPMLAGLAIGVAMLATTWALLYPAGEPVFTPLLQSPNDAAQRMLRDAGMAWPRMLTLALLAALAAFAVWRLVASTARQAVVVNAGLLTMGLLLALHQMVYPWYVTWLVPYAALFDDRRLRLVILAYSFTVFTMYWTTSVLIPVGTELHAGTRFLSMGLAHAPLLLGLKALLPDSAGQGRPPSARAGRPEPVPASAPGRR